MECGAREDAGLEESEYGAEEDACTAGEEDPVPDGRCELVVATTPVEYGALADPVGATVPLQTGV